MSAYDQFAASAPAGVIELRCLEISHPLFAAPLRLVHDYQDWTVTLETGGLATFSAAQFRTTPPKVTDNGQIERALQLDAVDGSIIALILPVATSDVSISCVFRTYLSNDLTGPQFDPPESTVLRNISIANGVLTATAQSADVINRKFPRRIYTVYNTPGLKR